MTITSCPSAEQVSILLSSASILAAEAMVNFSAAQQRKISAASSETSSSTPQTPTTTALPTRRVSLDKKVCFDTVTLAQSAMENLTEVSESSGNNSSVTSPTALSPEPPV